MMFGTRCSHVLIVVPEPVGHLLSKAKAGKNLASCTFVDCRRHAATFDQSLGHGWGGKRNLPHLASLSGA